MAAKLYHFPDYDLITDELEIHLPGRPLEALMEKAHRTLQADISESMKTFMPFGEGDLRKETGKLNVSMMGTEEMYAAAPPYGRYLYHGKVMVEEKTGKGPMNIPNVGLRFHKGAELKVTDKPLVLTHGNENARPEWYEAAKERDMAKWVRDVEKVLNGG